MLLTFVVDFKLPQLLQYTILTQKLCLSTVIVSV